MNNYRKAGPARFNPTPAQRLWVYGIIGAGLVVAAGYGWVTEEEVPRWLDLAEAILAPAGLALAAANVPSRRGEGSGPDGVGR